jgi:hypothetical protein
LMQKEYLQQGLLVPLPQQNYQPRLRSPQA